MAFVGMALATGAGAAAGIGGALISSSATKDAAQTQADAAKYAADLQYKEYQQQQQNEQPWLQAGQSALSQMQNPSFQQSFNAQDFQQDPGYQFNLQQGQNAIQASAAAQGGLMNTNTLAALSNYSQNAASNEYQNAYNRFNTNQTNSFNRLSSLAGIGQTANNNLNQAGQNYANQVGGIATSNANAQGAASIANGNMWGNTLSGIGSGLGKNWMTMSQMNQNQTPYNYNEMTVPDSSSYTMPTLGSQYGGSNPTGSFNPTAPLTGGLSFTSESNY